MTACKEDAAPWFLRGGGESGATARATDWASTALGPPEDWPSTLKTTVATILRARQPMFLWWGDELVQLYNDAYLPSFGVGKHPRAMGQQGRECWEEIWSIIGPQIADVMQRELGSYHTDALVPIFRNGRIEEVYWTYTYSPVFAEDGGVAGTLVICTETTNRVLAERRSSLLHEMVRETAFVAGLGALVERSFALLGQHALDVPCAAIATRDRATRRLTLGRNQGLAESGIAQLQAALEQAGRVDQAVVSLEQSLPVTAEVHSEAPVRQVYVATLQHRAGGVESVVMFGISARLSLDVAYLRFLEQLTAHLRVAWMRVEETERRAAIELERKNLLQQAPVAAALLIGPKHVFELANPLYCRMMGRSDIVGKAHSDAFPSLAGLPELLDRVYDTGEPFAADEFRLSFDRGRGGVEECFFRINLEPVNDSRGEVYGIMAVAVEITEQVLDRQRLEKAHRDRERLLIDLEQASRAKDEFLAMLGHELRNPLSPIITALDLMKMRSGGETTREQDIIRRQASHLVRLVDDLLDVAKIARGKVELRRESVDLNDVVTKAAETVSNLLEQRRHTLSIEMAPGLVCNGDPVRLAQVVGNVLANAARYTDAGGLISIVGRREADQIVLAIKDNGIGISQDLLPWVFKLFEQGKRSSERAQGGLGIGLALVKNLVSLHGGSVSVHSDGPGKGSEFVIHLPRMTSGEWRAQSDQRPHSRSALTPRRVLLVDDNVDAVELLEMTLANVGHDTAQATDALTALALAARFNPDVAILDIGLPVMDGYELAQRLRELPNCRNTRLIALTGYGQAHDRRRSASAGFDEHLVKPVDVQHLLEVLDTMGP